MSGCVHFLTFSLKTILLFLLITAQTQHQSRVKRFLIFPRQSPTRHQFIAGIGIPADLAYESLTVGHVLKAEFFLPYNATVFRQNPFLPEYKFQSTYLNHHINRKEMRNLLSQSTDLRWQLYAYIEHTLQRYGYNGHECLLEAICEANALKFTRHYSVIAELVHLVLSPSTTLNSNITEAQDFARAEKAASQPSNCKSYNCNMKLLNLISRVMHLKT